jgi:hypothetical protein
MRSGYQLASGLMNVALVPLSRSAPRVTQGFDIEAYNRNPTKKENYGQGQNLRFSAYFTPYVAFWVFLDMLT